MPLLTLYGLLLQLVTHTLGSSALSLSSDEVLTPFKSRNFSTIKEFMYVLPLSHVRQPKARIP